MNERKPPVWRLILRYGLLGGAIPFYLAAIGMVETFSQRFLIGNLLSFGHVFIILGAVGAGYLTARALRSERSRTVVGAGLAAGAVSSILLIVLIFLVQILVIQPAEGEAVFRWRDMFVNFSPGLVELLTFGQGLAVGIPLLVLLSALLGGLASALLVLPRHWSVALINGVVWTLGIGVFSENVSQIIQETLGRGLIRILFQNKALNPVAALVIFLAAFLVAYFRVHERVQSGWGALPATRQSQGRVVGLVLGIALLLALPWIVGLFLSQALFLIGLYVMMGLGLNIVVGYAGLLDLGYVAFFAFGAYTMGVLTTTGPLGLGDFTFWGALPICVLAGLIWGLLLGFPVLRMRGDYLAIVTLGFGEIIRILALSDWLAPIEGGAQGVLHIPNPQIGGAVLEIGGSKLEIGTLVMNNPQTMYYLVILGSVLAAFVTIRLRESRLGRQWMAMREDEDVAQAMGINLVQTKLLAFAIGAAFSALAGGIFAARLGTIFPHSFNLLISINALALIIVGGMGSIPGVIVGAVVLVGLPELLREFTEYRLLLYGVLLIVMMLVRPEGILPEVTRRRELHAGEEPLPRPTVETAGYSQH